MSELEYHRFKHPNVFILEYRRAHVVAPEYRIKRIKEKTELSILDLSSHLEQETQFVRNKSFTCLQAIKGGRKMENDKKIRYPLDLTLKHVPAARVVLRKLEVKKCGRSGLQASYPFIRKNLRSIFK